MEQSNLTIFLEDSLEAKEIPDCGRGVFAKVNIPSGTILLDSSFTSLAVILRKYRREVCAHCFEYNLGKHLPYRLPEVNFSFCNPSCQEEWTNATGSVGLEAWQTIEDLVRSKGGKGVKGLVDRVEEPKDDQGDITMGDYPRRPVKSEIDIAWSSISEVADLIRQQRVGPSTKRTRKAVNDALAIAVHPDTLYFLLAGILTHHAHTVSCKRPWNAFKSLAATDEPYPSSFHLTNHVNSYLHLLATLPAALLPSVSQSTIFSVASHDAHNAFGIHSLDDQGSEYFGWGVWPDASYFNHSCGYNVNKVREGRRWRFVTGQEVLKGEELTVTYLGGDEKELSPIERGKRTESIWGFVCACMVCAKQKDEKWNEIKNDNDNEDEGRGNKSLER